MRLLATHTSARPRGVQSSLQTYQSRERACTTVRFAQSEDQGPEARCNMYYEYNESYGE